MPPNKIPAQQKQLIRLSPGTAEITAMMMPPYSAGMTILGLGFIVYSVGMMVDETKCRRKKLRPISSAGGAIKNTDAVPKIMPERTRVNVELSWRPATERRTSITIGNAEAISHPRGG